MLHAFHKRFAAKRLVAAMVGLALFGSAAFWWTAEAPVVPPRSAPPLEHAALPFVTPRLDLETYRPQKAGFAVRYEGLKIPYRVMGLFVMPGEEVVLEALPSGKRADFAFLAEAGVVESISEAAWRWTTPDEPGLYLLTVVDWSSGETIRLNAFVMTPFDPARQALGGYRIGRYEEEPLRGSPAYERPEGFVEVTPANEDVRVAPHFVLGQFLCKQESGYPKYLALQEQLLLKLEQLLEAVNEAGIRTPTFHVMSGFRTPYYNKAIGNTTVYSQHLYGGAADIFVDTDGDRHMDDLNGDGDVTVEEARLLAAVAERLGAKPQHEPLVGGLGIYAPAPHRGPFIHVDVRGVRARW